MKLENYRFFEFYAVIGFDIKMYKNYKNSVKLFQASSNLIFLKCNKKLFRTLIL